MSHKKFGPDRFIRFDVYWIQTDRQAKFIYRCVHQKLVKSTGLTIRQQEQVVQYKQTDSTQSSPSREINVRNLFIHQNIFKIFFNI